MDLCNAILPKTEYDDVYAKTISLASDGLDPLLHEVLHLPQDKVHAKRKSQTAMVKRHIDGSTAEE